MAVLGQRDVEGGTAHVDGDHVLLLERGGYIEARLRCGRRAGVDGVDGAVRHRLTDGKAAVGLEVAHRLLRPQRAEIGIHRLHIFAHDRGEIGIHHRRRGAGIFPHLRIEFRAHGEDRIGQHLADDRGGTAFMVRVQHRPDEGDGDGLDAFLGEDLAGRAHVVVLHRDAHRAIGEHALAHALPQVARHQHGGGGIFRVVAEAVFLVAVADLDRVLMARGADEAGLAAAMRDQRIEAHGGAVDAQVAVGDEIRRRDAEIIGDQLEAILDGLGGIRWRRERLEQLDVARVAVGDDEVREGAASIDAETIGGAHGPSSLSQAADRSRRVAAMSTSRVSGSLITTP